MLLLLKKISVYVFSACKSKKKVQYRKKSAMRLQTLLT